MLFKVRNFHFFHVVAVVFDCGYDFVDVGVVVADYFGQTRYVRRAYFFHVSRFSYGVVHVRLAHTAFHTSNIQSDFFHTLPAFFFSALIVNQNLPLVNRI